MKSVVIDNVEYIPRSEVISDDVMKLLNTAYSLAWANSVYDPPCGCPTSKTVLREISDTLSSLNEILHFKK